MFERFYPDFKFSSINDITAEFFSQNGIKCAVLDIDNTLVSYKTETPFFGLKRYFERIVLKNYKG